MIFCRLENHKQYYSENKFNILLVCINRCMSMASSLVVDDLKISVGLRNKWSCKDCGSHAISALYYVVVVSTGLFTIIIIMLWPCIKQ